MSTRSEENGASSSTVTSMLQKQILSQKNTTAWLGIYLGDIHLRADLEEITIRVVREDT